MRPIKFRAWFKKHNEIYNVTQIDFELGCVCIEEDDWVLDFEEIILMQSTGLKDKNGVEIYEGDIVKIENHPFHNHIQIDGNYEVAINERKELCARSWLLYEVLPYASVIGSIHENPELLEVVE